jgi:hypothetical protein
MVIIKFNQSNSINQIQSINQSRWQNNLLLCSVSFDKNLFVAVPGGVKGNTAEIATVLLPQGRQPRTHAILTSIRQIWHEAMHSRAGTVLNTRWMD